MSIIFTPNSINHHCGNDNVCKEMNPCEMYIHTTKFSDKVTKGYKELITKIQRYGGMCNCVFV